MKRENGDGSEWKKKTFGPRLLLIPESHETKKTEKPFDD
jgi:hypothetical protein